MPKQNKQRFFRGLNRRDEYYLVGEGQLTDMKNMQSDDGLLTKRKGFSVEAHVDTDTDDNLYFPSILIILDRGDAPSRDDNLLFASFKLTTNGAFTPTAPSSPNETIITKLAFGLEQEENSDLILLESGDKLLLE